MTPLQFRSRRRIEGEFRNDVLRSLPMRLQVRSPTEATVTVHPDSVLESVWVELATTELVRELNRWTAGDHIPRQLFDECQAIVERGRAINGRVLAILKYGLNQAYIHHTLGYIQGGWLEWCQFPEYGFRPFPTFVRQVVVDQELVTSSNFDPSVAAQALLDRDFRPLAAMAHLHRARLEQEDPRARWIEATIAAELAVKEVLSRIEPKLTSLLFELPSPPIEKLYGRVLEVYAGERSPMRKQLIAGATRRNALIHRPDTQDPDATEATLYVQDVQTAILHLVSLLDRTDATAAHFYRASRVKLTIGDVPKPSGEQ